MTEQPFDRDEIRRRLLLRLFGHPVTLLPTVVGAAGLMSPLFLSDWTMPVFAGIVGLVVGASSLALRGLLGRETITRKVVEELEDEAADAKQQRLSTLWDRLAADDDERDERYLTDLHKLTQTVREDDRWRRHVDVVVAADILGDLDGLFEQAVTDLERGVELRETASELHAPSARQGLMQERERILAEVEASIDAISHLLTQLQVLGASARPAGKELDKLRSSLSHTLAAARAATAETSAGSASTEARLRAARRRAQSKEPS